MAPSSRTTQFNHLHKVLKKHYKPVTPDPERPVLEHLLYACCLEDAHYEAADEAFAAVMHTFFDLNEIRVTTIAELAEVMSALPDSRAAANRMKRALQHVFEETYIFDLEERRKGNLGPTVKWLQKVDGATGFTVAYVVQSALGGHAIPLDTGTVRALHVVNLADDKDVEALAVPGLERAIAKSKGIEFGSMLHQLGADFTANPYSPAVREILLQIDPEAKDRLPKRRSRKAAAKKEAQEPAAPPKKKKKAAAGKKAAASKSKPAAAKKKTAKKTAATKRTPAAKKKKTTSAKKKTSDARTKAAKSKKKTTRNGLSKRKPR